MPPKEESIPDVVPETGSSSNFSEASPKGDDEFGSQREPFLAFVPKVGKWATGIVANEVTIATKAVVAFPSFSKGFLQDTVSFYKENPRVLFDEVISGFTVAIMQVPESIAFSFVAGVPPLSGLQATFWMALITGIFGGKPGMISGTCRRFSF